MLLHRYLTQMTDESQDSIFEIYRMVHEKSDFSKGRRGLRLFRMRDYLVVFTSTSAGCGLELNEDAISKP